MESLPVLLFKFSSDTFWGASAFFFGSLYRSYLSDTCKNKTRGSLLLFVAWPTPFEKLTSKCYVRGRKIERGMASHKYIAKQRLYHQHLGWPSFYIPGIRWICFAGAFPDFHQIVAQLLCRSILRWCWCSLLLLLFCSGLKWPTIVYSPRLVRVVISHKSCVQHNRSWG